MNKMVLFLCGFVLMVAGIILVLRDWPSLVIVFKGVSGPLLAVAGMVMLFASSLNKNV